MRDKREAIRQEIQGLMSGANAMINEARRLAVENDITLDFSLGGNLNFRLWNNPAPLGSFEAVSDWDSSDAWDDSGCTI